MSPVHVLQAAAEAERGRRRSHRVSRARAAGSLAALPLGLFFLPAFVLVAVVPVVVGSLATLGGALVSTVVSSAFAGTLYPLAITGLAAGVVVLTCWKFADNRWVRATVDEPGVVAPLGAASP